MWKKSRSARFQAGRVLDEAGQDSREANSASQQAQSRPATRSTFNRGEIMKPSSIFAALAVFCFAFAVPAHSQNPEIKFIADTLVVQADGTYQADPDLATLTFDITAQDKELKPTYD